jgi:undecaprenyl-diphosphatase
MNEGEGDTMPEIDAIPEITVARSVSRITRLELPLCRLLNGVRSRGLLRLFSIVSRLGNGYFWLAVALALLAADGAGAWPAVRHLTLATAVGLSLYKLLKARTGRPRPFNAEDGFHLTITPLDELSFPSGHTLHAVAFTLVLYAYYPLAFWLVLPFTVLVALSRVVLGLHYPSDVAAGVALGSLVALVVLRI